MNTFLPAFMRLALGAIIAGSLTISTNGYAQYESATSGDSYGGTEGVLNAVDLNNRPLIDASYIAVMPQYRISKSDPVLDRGFGGNILVGYRNKKYGLETGFGYGSESGVTISHFIINGLWFPFESVPMLYGVIGGGASRYAMYPFEQSPRPIESNRHFITANIQGGAGYILPLRWGRYEYGIRLEGLYRVSDRFIEREAEYIADISAPDTFKDILINLGLHIPLRRLPAAPPEPEPVQVVAPLAPVDSDGDGVPDNLDQCPNTPLGESVDDVGCPLPLPLPPCETPELGERVSLSGCGTGDVIVLRGVNFDFNKSSLTVNAMRLLDMVADELKANPHIDVEIGGHTDSKGADAYNQRLSEQRAQSVRGYLMGEGVAAAQLSARGYGENNPIADNDTEAGRELNRRVELKIIGTAPARVTRGVNPQVESNAAAQDASLADEPIQEDEDVSGTDDQSAPAANEQSPPNDDLDGLFDF